MTEQVKRAISGANDPLPNEIAKINGDIDYMLGYVKMEMCICLPTATKLIDGVVALTSLVETRNSVLNAVYACKSPHANMSIDDFIGHYMTSGEGAPNDITRLFALRDVAEGIVKRSNEDKGLVKPAFARTDQNYVRLNQAAYSMIETAQRHSTGLKPREFARGLENLLGSLDQK